MLLHSALWGESLPLWDPIVNTVLQMRPWKEQNCLQNPDELKANGKEIYSALHGSDIPTVCVVFVER